MNAIAEGIFLAVSYGSVFYTAHVCQNAIKRRVEEGQYKPPMSAYMLPLSVVMFSSTALTRVPALSHNMTMGYGATGVSSLMQIMVLGGVAWYK